MLIISIIIAIFITVFLIYSYLPSYLNKKKFFKKDHSSEKVIYLTFDDGPSKYTNELLDLLDYYNIKATFFCVANFAKENEDIISRMKKSNHLIALHSLKHKNAMFQGILETKFDIEKSLEIMNNLGVEIKYYRPPWGDSNLYLLKKLRNKGIYPILWNVMADDWKAKTTEHIIADKLLKRVKQGDIICLHDGRGANKAPLRTINALKIVIPAFLEKGFKFKKIDEYKF